MGAALELQTERVLSPVAYLRGLIHRAAAGQFVPELAPRIDRKVTLVLGPSGVGKSTLINRLVPAAGALTAEISHALNSGKHTTTHARRYRLPDAACPGATLIDSPGLQEFGLSEMEIVLSKQSQPDVHAVLYDAASTVVQYNLQLQDGQTFTTLEGLKLQVKRSKGVYQEGETLKIEY